MTLAHDHIMGLGGEQYVLSIYMPMSLAFM